MKRIPPQSSEPESAVKYWRGIDQLEGAPSSREWTEREFPDGAYEAGSEFSRRDFLSLMGASLGLAGMGMLGVGCRRPVEMIVPFGKQPQGYIHGVPQFFASAMPRRGGAIPLLVKSQEGRPIKVEGNPDHPVSNGATDVYTQASVLNLYDADRVRSSTVEGKPVKRDAALKALAKVAERSPKGKGLFILAERSGSPTRARLHKLMSEAAWYLYEPVDFDIHREAAQSVFGQDVTPRYSFEKAKVIVSLDCDFLGAEEGAWLNIRGFARGRRIAKSGESINRLYVAEPLMSQAGMNADHRVRVPASAIAIIARILLARVSNEEAPALTPSCDLRWIEECAKDLQLHMGSSLVVAGYRQPLAVHQLALAINDALGNIGKTVELIKSETEPTGKLSDLASQIKSGKVETLVILGGNPVYNAPADLDWKALQSEIKQVIRLSHSEDESSEGVWMQLPLAHYLESWGDDFAGDGSLTSVQPLIQPLFEGFSEIEVLAALAGIEPNGHELVRQTFKVIAGEAGFEEKWKQYLHDGYLKGSAAKAVAVTIKSAVVADAKEKASSAPTVSIKELEVVFTRDLSLDDGRFANNSWLQELPDPVTKLVWDNAMLISRATAAALGAKNNQIVEITVGGRTVSGPVWVQPGQADNTIGIALGYGRSKGGRIGTFKGQPVGFDGYKIRASDKMHFATGASLKLTSSKYEFACTQEHWSMESRPIIREANLAEFNSDPKFAHKMDLDAHMPNAGPIYVHPYDAKPKLKSDIHQWGMVVDMNACVGCSACVIACQSENNIPVVGKDQVKKGREMHWMRIDRYYTGTSNEPHRGEHGFDENQYKEKWIDDPQVVTQPMLCQHCENAPCESVCPVNATVHDEEGLNTMVYNRCVGTRYCSNNCAWKVRRFNYFDFNKRPLDKLYKSPLFSPSLFMDWIKDTGTSNKDEDEWELLKLVRNPDVTVRMRGVMEKCTYCVQRIEGAKIAQKVKAGASGDVMVKEGAFKTACQQACPAEAIDFGNLLDSTSRVSKAKTNVRNYQVLGFLDNKARTTYLAKVRNPNPLMPDYQDRPLSTKDYEHRNHHDAGADGKAPVKHDKKGGH